MLLRESKQDSKCYRPSEPA